MVVSLVLHEPALERGRWYPALDSSSFRNAPPSDTEVNRGVAIESGRLTRPTRQFGGRVEGKGLHPSTAKCHVKNGHHVFDPLKCISLLTRAQKGRTKLKAKDPQ